MAPSAGFIEQGEVTLHKYRNDWRKRGHRGQQYVPAGKGIRVVWLTLGQKLHFPRTLVDIGIDSLCWEAGHPSKLYLVTSSIWSHRCVQSQVAIAGTARFSLLCIEDSR